jgi:hypothetical protein
LRLKSYRGGGSIWTIAGKLTCFGIRSEVRMGPFEVRHQQTASQTSLTCPDGMRPLPRFSHSAYDRPLFTSTLQTCPPGRRPSSGSRIDWMAKTSSKSCRRAPRSSHPRLRRVLGLKVVLLLDKQDVARVSHHIFVCFTSREFGRHCFTIAWQCAAHRTIPVCYSSAGSSKDVPQTEVPD